MILADEHRAHEIICFLAGQYVKGWKAFLIAEQIHIAEVNQVSKISKELGTIIRISCLETSVIALANIISSQKDSIHLDYLFDYAARVPSAFPLSPKGESLAKIVDDYRHLYKQFGQTRTKVFDQRDQLLVHLDKKLLENPRLHMNNPISDDELKHIYSFLHTTIYTFATYLSNKDNLPTFDKVKSREIKNDFSIMLS
ncbi:MAG: hypothetical protein HYR70_01390 [Chloroflexi bacterium]|nr:hypothetical protein [Chloroflexota bacterium]MBI3341225.1 hypothetical protein [Chloroflexota bacterium]